MIETGFPCISTIKESEGGGGEAPIHDGCLFNMVADKVDAYLGAYLRK